MTFPLGLFSFLSAAELRVMNSFSTVSSPVCSKLLRTFF